MITPINEWFSTHRTGTLKGLSALEIAKKLGFAPNVDDDPDKVQYSWAFSIDGKKAAIWDYKGSSVDKQFSVYDPEGALANNKLFYNFIAKGF
jgi:hypothetical protein